MKTCAFLPCTLSLARSINAAIQTVRRISGEFNLSTKNQVFIIFSEASQGKVVKERENIAMAVIDCGRCFGSASIERKVVVSLIIQFAVGCPIFGSQSQCFY